MKKRPTTRFRTIKPERMRHGTRGCYVAQKCRCAACRFANRVYYHERMQRRLDGQAEGSVNPTAGETKLFTRTNSRGQKYSVRGRACPGVDGKPCVAGGAWLRTGAKACSRCFERSTVWNGLVDVAPARAHLAKLSAVGVGYKAVADAAGVAYSLTGGIAMGAIKKCRALTLKKILAVDEGARADHSIVDSDRLVQNFLWLRREGFTLMQLSPLLGYEARTGAHVLLAQARRRGKVVAINDARVQRLCNRVEAGEIAPAPKPTIPAGPTRRMLHRLLSEGFNRKQLTKRIGVTVQQVLLSKRVRRSTAEKVKTFHDEVTAGSEAERTMEVDRAFKEIRHHLDPASETPEERENRRMEQERGAARRRMLAAYAEGVSMQDLEERFGMDAATVARIARREGVVRADEREEVVA